MVALVGLPSSSQSFWTSLNPSGQTCIDWQTWCRCVGGIRDYACSESGSEPRKYRCEQSLVEDGEGLIEALWGCESTTPRSDKRCPRLSNTSKNCEASRFFAQRLLGALDQSGLDCIWTSKNCEASRFLAQRLLGALDQSGLDCIWTEMEWTGGGGRPQPTLRMWLCGVCVGMCQLFILLLGTWFVGVASNGRWFEKCIRDRWCLLHWVSTLVFSHKQELDRLA